MATALALLLLWRLRILLLRACLPLLLFALLAALSGLLALTLSALSLAGIRVALSLGLLVLLPGVPFFVRFCVRHEGSPLCFVSSGEVEVTSSARGT